MFGFSLGMTKERISNKYIRGTAQVEQFGERVKVKAEMVWICAEEGLWIYWTKNVEYGAARQGLKRKTRQEADGWSEGGNADS